MSLRFHLPLAAGCLLVLASCAGDGGTEAAASPAPQQAFRMKSGDLGDDDFGRIQDKYGAINQRLEKGGSASESGRSMNSEYQGELARREFAAKDYEKKAFWGTKDYEKMVYGGDLDGSRFHKGAREGTKSAREGTMMSREDSRAFATREVETAAARESGRGAIDTPSDARTDTRRRVYAQPEVLDVNSHRALTIDDTRKMLGR